MGARRRCGRWRCVTLPRSKLAQDGMVTEGLPPLEVWRTDPRNMTPVAINPSYWGGCQLRTHARAFNGATSTGEQRHARSGTDLRPPIYRIKFSLEKQRARSLSLSRVFLF